MRERFVLDRKENILFINFAGLKIESREQVDEMASLVREAVELNGGRVYAVVNYEGTEIAPEIVQYYGERIKALQDRYAMTTVRYSSSGLTRSVLRYLGAAFDLESNIFTTREEAIRAIRELEQRSPVKRVVSSWAVLDPRRSVLGKLLAVWLAGLLFLLIVYLALVYRATSPEQLSTLHAFGAMATVSLLVVALLSALVLHTAVIRPLRQMDGLARSLVVGSAFEPVKVTSDDEVGSLVRVLNEAAQQLRKEIERLSGLYHISLMMGTGAAVSTICELLTRKIARLLGADMCVILLSDEKEQLIYAQLPAYGVSDHHVQSLRSPLSEKNIATRVYKTGEPYLSNNIAADSLISKSAADLLGVSAILAVPLQAGEITLGTLEVMNKAGGFVEDDKRLVTIFASQAAHLIVNAQLFEQVKESEERYRQIFESALDGLYRSTPDGRLVTVNPALASMLGCNAPEDLIGANLIQDFFVDPSDSAHVLEEVRRQGLALDVECELRRGRAGAENVPARISIRAVTDAASHEQYHLGIVRNVTEQKRLSEQLIISKQLAVVGELVAGVAHEVRNPLCGITTTLSALARQLKDRETVQPFVDVIMTEADRLNRLMEELLEHSRPSRPDNHPTDIRDLVREIIGEWSAQAEARGIHLAFEYPGILPNLRLDRRKMHGVFANLLNNALNHTGPGGHIKVRLSETKPAHRRNGHKEITVEIKDDGAGISPDNLPKIFEPFFTTRTSGTGLGLAIVRKTVHDHGGAITAHSEKGEGTTFIINLPVKGGDEA
ncbi:MAG TPA: ATP-binding protein [Pyrinomonadaceae bacterium]|jgi:PAS domain S-box-containing protein